MFGVLVFGVLVVGGWFVCVWIYRIFLGGGVEGLGCVEGGGGVLSVLVIWGVWRMGFGLGLVGGSWIFWVCCWVWGWGGGCWLFRMFLRGGGGGGGGGGGVVGGGGLIGLGGGGFVVVGCGFMWGVVGRVCVISCSCLFPWVLWGLGLWCLLWFGVRGIGVLFLLGFFLFGGGVWVGGGGGGGGGGGWCGVFGGWFGVGVGGGCVCWVLCVGCVVGVLGLCMVVGVVVWCWWGGSLGVGFGGGGGGGGGGCWGGGGGGGVGVGWGGGGGVGGCWGGGGGWGGAPQAIIFSPARRLPRSPRPQWGWAAVSGRCSRGWRCCSRIDVIERRHHVDHDWPPGDSHRLACCPRRLRRSSDRVIDLVGAGVRRSTRRCRSG